jgi:hypothetical protein
LFISATKLFGGKRVLMSSVLVELYGSVHWLEFKACRLKVALPVPVNVEEAKSTDGAEAS